MKLSQLFRRTRASEVTADKSYEVEQQLGNLAQIMSAYEGALEAARREGLPDEFVHAASVLLTQLNGTPDNTPGAIQAMRDVDGDLAATTAFLEKWKHYGDQFGHVELLPIMFDLRLALVRFRDLVCSLTASERSLIERYATFGAAVLRQ